MNCYTKTSINVTSGLNWSLQTGAAPGPAPATASSGSSGGRRQLLPFARLLAPWGKPADKSGILSAKIYTKIYQKKPKYVQDTSKIFILDILDTSWIYLDISWYAIDIYVWYFSVY